MDEDHLSVVTMISAAASAMLVFAQDIAGMLDSPIVSKRKGLTILVTVVSAYLRWKAGKPFVMQFSKADWILIPGKEHREIIVTRAKHKKGKHPRVTIQFLKENGSYGGGETGKEFRANGDLSLYANYGFDGQVVITR